MIESLMLIFFCHVFHFLASLPVPHPLCYDILLTKAFAPEFDELSAMKPSQPASNAPAQAGLVMAIR